MDALPYATPPRWWAPRPRPIFVRALRPLRILIRQRWQEGVYGVDLRGLEHLREAAGRDQGIIITPNHAAHSDPFVMLRAGDALGRMCYYMVAWQSFLLLSPLARWVIQAHGAFSIDREGNDLRAFRQAVEVVGQTRNPLVIFAEGEVYHNSDQVAPFRQGAAAVALAALRRARRPVACVPAAIRYRYLKDPTPELVPLVDAMEQKRSLGPRRNWPLAPRLARLADDVLARHEKHFLGRVETGAFATRATALTDAILRALEDRHGTAPDGTDVPERVARLRRAAIKQTENSPPDSDGARQAARDLADLDTAVQVYSYTNDYTSDDPPIERLAEIVDKFEEDLLGVTTARTRAARRAVVRFGPAVAAAPFQERRDGVRALTEAMEQKVRELLDELIADLSFRKPMNRAGAYS
jgi:1-acyl-sn-glycerol-3-phosphate acyltransferase